MSKLNEDKRVRHKAQKGDKKCIQNSDGTSWKAKTWKTKKEIKKVKSSRYRPGVAQRVGRGIALLFHDHGTRKGEWPAAHPGRNLPPG